MAQYKEQRTCDRFHYFTALNKAAQMLTLAGSYAEAEVGCEMALSQAGLSKAVSLRVGGTPCFVQGFVRCVCVCNCAYHRSCAEYACLVGARLQGVVTPCCFPFLPAANVLRLDSLTGLTAGLLHCTGVVTPAGCEMLACHTESHAAQP